MRIAILSEQATIDAVLAPLELLPHELFLLPPKNSALRECGEVSVVLVDVTGSNLLSARDLCRSMAAAHPDVPIAVAINEASVIALDATWAVDDFIFPTASPAEIEARLRLLMSRRPVPVEEADDSGVVSLGALIVDDTTYTARIHGTPMDLTYKAFELLYYLVQNSGRVFTREQLLQDVWGYDFFGGTRTVDVHVRRLRAKLGAEHEGLIATVRNVGYKAVKPESAR